MSACTLEATEATCGHGELVRGFAWVPAIVYLVAAIVGLVDLFLGAPGSVATVVVLVVAAICLAISLTAAYFATNDGTKSLSSGFIGNVFSKGFWDGALVFRLTFLILGVFAVLVFAAGAAALPRGTSVQEIDGVYYSVNSSERVEITVAEAQYLEAARNTLIPIGSAMLLSTLSAGLLRGTSALRRQKVNGLKRGM